ncbi:protein tweety homolog 1-like, partial [Scyliorhinus torazame]|uniref:protein tweety homolog 1-like n=1 Tax=Scyliorhinus torazame TaxID=75743 RepID=UPI003B5CFB4A
MPSPSRGQARSQGASELGERRKAADSWALGGGRGELSATSQPFNPRSGSPLHPLVAEPEILTVPTTTAPHAMDNTLGYSPSRWAHFLHGLPHVNLHLEPVDNRFSPREWQYQQALLFLAGFAILCLVLNLLLILIYFLRLCCCSQRERDGSSEQPSRCLTWSSMAALIICCTGVGIGFYGNSEINDGMYQAALSLAQMNHTLLTMETL